MLLSEVEKSGWFFFNGLEKLEAIFQKYLNI